MLDHDAYMQDFLYVFQTLESWGPNSPADTLKAYQQLNFRPKSILDIGCGNGDSTITLASLSGAKIIAIDTEQSALDKLEQKITLHQLEERVSSKRESMTELSFDYEKFDLIWAEASIYVMGVQNALKQWKPLLQKEGFLVFSDLVWLVDSANQELTEFWKDEYPDMQTIDTRLEQIKKEGYIVTNSFTVSDAAWKRYYEPLQERVKELAHEMKHSLALKDIQKELNIYKKYLSKFGYQFFILQKCES